MLAAKFAPCQSPLAMDIDPQILIFIGSLIAIFALAWFASFLKLGGDPRITSPADVARIANEIFDGFDPVSTAIDREGTAALARDKEGRIMVIRRHGNRFAGRVLTRRAHAQAEGERIVIDTGEKRFGPVALTIEDAAPWAGAVNALDKTRNA